MATPWWVELRRVVGAVDGVEGRKDLWTFSGIESRPDPGTRHLTDGLVTRLARLAKIPAVAPAISHEEPAVCGVLDKTDHPVFRWSLVQSRWACS